MTKQRITRNISIAMMATLGLTGLAACQGSSPGLDEGADTAQSIKASGGTEGANFAADRALSGAAPAIGSPKDNTSGSTVETDNADNSMSNIIKSGSVTIESTDVEGDYNKLRDIITRGGGSIVNSLTNINGKTTDSAYSADNGDSLSRHYNPIPGDSAVLSIKVPSKGYEALLRELKTVAKVVADSDNSVDVGLEITGLDAKIESGTKSITRLEALLSEAKSVADVLKVEQALEARRSELSSLDAQRAHLRRQVSESTITVTVLSPIANKPTYDELNWFQKVWEQVSDNSVGAVTIALTVIIFAAPLVLVVWLLALLASKMRRKRTAASAARPYSPRVPQVPVVPGDNNARIDGSATGHNGDRVNSGSKASPGRTFTVTAQGDPGDADVVADSADTDSALEEEGESGTGS